MKSLQSLKIICLQLKNDRTKITDVTQEISHLTQAFKPESCARQVFIFTHIKDPVVFNQSLQLAAYKTQACHYLTGLKAYAFLLSWIVGGEYRKVKKGSKLALYNDNHVLGVFKKNWIIFKKKNASNPELIKEYDKIISILLEDAHQIRQRMEAKIYKEGQQLRDTLDTVIENIIFSRTYSLPVLHDTAHEPPHHYLASLNQFLSEKIELMTSHTLLSEGESNLFASPAKKAIFNKLLIHCRQHKMLNEMIAANESILCEPVNTLNFSK